MATSSILTDIILKTPEEVEAFFEAVEKANEWKPKKVVMKHKVKQLKGKEIKKYFKSNYGW